MIGMISLLDALNDLGFASLAKANDCKLRMRDLNGKFDPLGACPA
jgi:hypothetical protein